MDALGDLVAGLPEGLLPAGRLVRPAMGGEPAYWLSDAPVAAGTWPRVRAEHPRSGLWPLLLEGSRENPDDPWAIGEVFRDGPPLPDAADAGELMARWWRDYTHLGEGDHLSRAERDAVTAPFGRAWPGLAPAGNAQKDPGVFADELADCRATDGRPWLGLVAVSRGADAAWAAGWPGTVNYHPARLLSSVLRSWEDRFGVRVVRVASATLELSVAAPPTTSKEAQRIAAEHFALCPDNVWQSGYKDLSAYAEDLIGTNNWSFWWD